MTQRVGELAVQTGRPEFRSQHLNKKSEMPHALVTSVGGRARKQKNRWTSLAISLPKKMSSRFRFSERPHFNGVRWRETDYNQQQATLASI